MLLWYATIADLTEAGSAGLAPYAGAAMAMGAADVQWLDLAVAAVPAAAWTAFDQSVRSKAIFMHQGEEFVDEIDLIYLLSTNGLAYNKNPGPEELPQCSLAWPTLRIHVIANPPAPAAPVLGAWSDAARIYGFIDRLVNVRGEWAALHNALYWLGENLAMRYVPDNTAAPAGPFFHYQGPLSSVTALQCECLRILI